ncbi:alpha/beta hydrolase [Flavobacterium crassostreae]|uniref:Alpha/beta hydrolase n=1 Tax=Flavobacterium crassostreae TaxID=1763534 RepID=A0A1B9E3I3_9FLAO|nr:alpha/beta fold hydrolase [Flavobacterium crassostreae]OCB76502.1 alpha/beta hydrolase [Flavobacterium crassostreae]
MKKIVKTIVAKSIGAYINLLSYIAPNKAVQLAYALFSEPREGKFTKDKLPAILQEAETTTHYHHNAHFQTYIWSGNQTVILLVHGWESNASRWENILPYLKKSGSTIIALDGPAHGLSSGKEFNIPQYASFINIVAQKHQPQYIIGHSLGAKTCLYYQATYQNNAIQKMVILGSPSDFKVILHNYIQMLGLNTTIYKGLEKHYKTHFDLNLKDFSGKYFASQITTKGFIAHDISDSIVLFKEAQKIAQHWKEAVLVETNGLGHSMHDAALYTKIAHFLFDSNTFISKK